MANEIKDSICLDDIIIDVDGRDYEVTDEGETGVEALDAEFNAKTFQFDQLEIVKLSWRGKSKFKVKQ